jgi:hypothetical protein
MTAGGVMDIKTAALKCPDHLFGRERRQLVHGSYLREVNRYFLPQWFILLFFSTLIVFRAGHEIARSSGALGSQD